jgi:hypothetical protein
MKAKGLFICSLIFIVACNTSQREQQLKELSVQDSTLLEQARQKDSAISSYIHSMNMIQDNLDSIKQKEKVLSLRSKEGAPATDKVIADIKAMDELILKDNRDIAQLQSRVRKMNKKDADLEKIVAHLNKELTDRDSDIASLQYLLSQSNASMKSVVEQFNDSMASLNMERAQNGSLTSEVNTVYYAVGTIKELKEKGVITKEGGVIGIGRTPKLKQNFNSKYFTKADKTILNTIPLYAHFSKIVTDHPESAFKVQGTQKADSLFITNPDTFWSESKYLVVVVK